MSPALLALLLLAGPFQGRSYDVEPATSTVRYHIVHKLHDVTGTTSTVEGKAVIRPDGRVLAQVRVPLASFDSGERNRDADMREAVEARRFPFVVFKGTATLEPERLAAGGPLALEVRLDGEVELHGVRRPVAVPLRVELAADGGGRARGAFEVSLDAFGIARPSLLFVKIDDACRIEVDLALREAKP
jgi:polyisoprenoid-binding protein YceI